MGDVGEEVEEGGLASVRRVSRIPVVESTIGLATDIYGKVKDSNAVVGNVLTAAEAKLKEAAALAQPVATKLEGPIAKLDSALCTGLDYVQTNVPSINLPPRQMLENTKMAVKSAAEPAIKCVCAMTEYGAQRLASMAGGGGGGRGGGDSPCPAGDKCCLHGKHNKKDD